MIKSDMKRFCFLMAALGEAFSQEASPQKVEIYYQALSDLDIVTIEKSVWQVINTRATASFPKVAEIREALRVDAEDTAILALDKFERAVREIGPYESVIFDDPVIHRVVDSFDGGWTGLCNMTGEEWIWAKKDWLKLYKALATDTKRRTPVKLIGLIEHENSVNGHFDNIPKPKIVGDAVVALEWTGKVVQTIEIYNPVKQLLQNIGQ